MRLSKIKLAGFKSFVDPTTITFPSSLVGVVGPNGCGKSNVIDAVRWVMGESSAKMLRGESMADVIFNGSRARKPLGMAEVSLHLTGAEGIGSVAVGDHPIVAGGIPIVTGAGLAAQLDGKGRVAAIEHPFGRPFGDVGDGETQLAVLRAALAVFETCQTQHCVYIAGLHSQRPQVHAASVSSVADASPAAF